MATYGIEIDGDTLRGIVVREQNSLLGERFAGACDQNTISKAEWSTANRCRLYSQM